ncbi:hypothetical protein GCM10020000_07100 [Streptomyces olivoverticillatus]
MPWFKIDDSAHSHPKFVRAGNAALGLWMRCGAYSAQHLLEGWVPKEIVKPFNGTAAQVRKLIEAGLWHAAGHDCPRCPPSPPCWRLPDARLLGGRTERFQGPGGGEPEGSRGPRSEVPGAGRGSKNAIQIAREMNRIHTHFAREMNPTFSGSAAGQEGLSQRTPLDSVTP